MRVVVVALLSSVRTWTCVEHGGKVKRAFNVGFVCKRGNSLHSSLILLFLCVSSWDVDEGTQSMHNPSNEKSSEEQSLHYRLQCNDSASTW